MLPTNARHSWLDTPRRVGTSRHWSNQAGLLGLMLGWLVPAAATATLAYTDGMLWGVLLMLSPFHTASALAGGIMGLLLGLLEPALLDRVRGLLPLSLIALLQTIPGAIAGGTAGAAWGGSLMLFAGEPVAAVAGIFAGAGAAVGAIAALTWWMPFTVATVLGYQPLARWSTRAVGLGLPAFVAALTALLLL